jgi:hypothetical protein
MSKWLCSASVVHCGGIIAAADSLCEKKKHISPGIFPGLVFLC